MESAEEKRKKKYSFRVRYENEEDEGGIGVEQQKVWVELKIKGMGGEKKNEREIVGEKIYHKKNANVEKRESESADASRTWTQNAIKNLSCELWCFPCECKYSVDFASNLRWPINLDSVFCCMSTTETEFLQEFEFNSEVELRWSHK
jgi:hypothetical protein